MFVLNKRTCIFAQTSNMPSTGRETAMLMGITLSEYVRDMGYNVTLLADSTSRWIKSIPLSRVEYPIEFNEQVCAQKISSFYSRAGKVLCEGGPSRNGSVSIFGTVSCEGGNFADPICSMNINCASAFWGLDRKLAQRRHFPSLNWNVSFSKYSNLDSFYKDVDFEFPLLKSKIKNFLQLENDLSEIIQLVGIVSLFCFSCFERSKDCLDERDKLKYEIAQLVKNEFLAQDGFSSYDKFCPLYKTVWMMRNIMLYADLAHKAIEETNQVWFIIKLKTKDLLYKLSCMKFEVKGFLFFLMIP